MALGGQPEQHSGRVPGGKGTLGVRCRVDFLFRVKDFGGLLSWELVIVCCAVQALGIGVKVSRRSGFQALGLKDDAVDHS